MSDTSEQIERKSTRTGGVKKILWVISLLILISGIIWFLEREEVPTETTYQSSMEQKRWVIRWYESKRGERKHRIQIRESSATKFVFSVGSSKNKMWFTWDKTQNPDHGTWHRAGTDYEGIWKLTKVNKNGKTFLKGYHTFGGETYETFIESI